ncbi:hypothetical protein M2302_002239 [Micromonospora sp. A200]|uniref:VG15 protein n=1 Tax=Micromonospora sp. A200 TaxID=2940568 RepID=UPI0024760F41|nr:hypothetical protein [Micromonospora sp. A200]MDH6462064.1 hypothetical protein [Micromonospora sp. A200]
MTPQQKAAEAEKASVAYHLALTQIGVATVEDAIKLWAGVPPTATAQQSAAWMAKAIHLVMTRRGLSRELALAYYRLVRALRTGRTVADPRKPEPAYVTLDMLRREFEELAQPQARQAPQEGATEATPTETTPEPAETPSEEQEPAADTENEEAENEEADDDRIEVETIAGLDRELERLEREAVVEARVVLQALGPDNLTKKLHKIDTDAPAKEVDALREEAHRKAGSRQAAAAERVAMDGARGFVWRVAQRDRRVIGYVRLSRTGTPCGWCAMLISRGAVYKSAKSATYADGDRYHDNCHCYAEPIYSETQYDTSDLTALNRKYQKLWPKVTSGLSGERAVSAWRRFIRQEERDRAQVARRESNVQEA